MIFKNDSFENLISFNFSHLWKELSSIDSTNLGIIIDSKLIQKENALSPITFTEYSSENIIDFIFLQLWKA